MKIYVVTKGSHNFAVMQYAFYDLEEAKKCRDRFDFGKGASSHYSTIHVLEIYNKCDDLIKDARLWTK